MSESNQTFEKAQELYQAQLLKLGLTIQTVSIAQFETPQHPMNPNLYFQLCGVTGFQKLNGKDYSTYLSMWRERHEAWKNAPPSFH